MKQSDLIKRTLRHIGIIALVSLGLSLIFQLVLNVGAFFPGFLAAFILIFLSGSVLYTAWCLVGCPKALAWMIFAAFIIRLSFAVFFAWGLPRFGYPTRPQEMGFVYEDSFRREENAWSLAKSGDPLITAFGDNYETDQYGGMLFLSAFIYRNLSPDAYRPALISILSAGVMTLSIPFLWGAMNGRFATKTVLWAGWILALYPEGILLGSAQLREPYFILLMSILFWSVIHIRERRKFRLSIPVFILSALSLFLFSFRMAIPMIGVMLLWFWVDLSKDIKRHWVKFAVWGGIILSGMTLLWLMRYWVDAVLFWDTLVSVRRSGLVQFQLESLPQWLHFPFILVYGIFQPVLPAALAAPAPWIWRGLGIFRALGWYALLPLLAYALIRVWSMPSSRKKRWMILMVLFVWVWILVASARAGGDQWDNPRYRTIFLPWMAITAGWGVTYAQETQDRWLGRSLIIEGIFLAFFTNWYFSRYYANIPRLDFWMMIGLIFLLNLTVIFGGWLLDRRRMGKIEKGGP